MAEPGQIQMETICARLRALSLSGYACSNHVLRIIFKKMAHVTGPENQLLIALITELKKRSNEQSANLWRRIALDLERPSRMRRVVNLSRINRFSQENDIIVVPGKVLGSGDLHHKVSIAAYQFSEQAKEKLQKIGAKIVPLLELSKEKPDGRNIKIIG